LKPHSTGPPRSAPAQSRISYRTVEARGPRVVLLGPDRICVTAGRIRPEIETLLRTQMRRLQCILSEQGCRFAGRRLADASIPVHKYLAGIAGARR
jgi:hypothetical protein